MTEQNGSTRRDFLRRLLVGAGVAAFATNCRCEEDNVKWSDEAADPSEEPRKPEPAAAETPPPAPEPAPELAPEEPPKVEKPVKKKGKR
jgi:hypothetical protein